MVVMFDVTNPVERAHVMTKREVTPVVLDSKAVLSGDEDSFRVLLERVVQEVLEAEMTEALQAGKEERSAARLGYRSGYYAPAEFWCATARVFRLGTAFKNCTTSSVLRATGNLRGSRAYAIRSGISPSQASRRRRSAGADCLVKRCPRNTGRNQMDLERAYIFQTQSIRRPAKIRAELRDRSGQ